MTPECAREQDVLDAAAAGRWPLRADQDLRDHVEACEVCRDVAEIAGPFVEERDLAWTESEVPSASLVWWRAQIRAREEAARVAGRPIVITQTVAIALLAAAAVLLMPASLRWLRASASAAAIAASSVTPRAADISDALSLATGSAVPLMALTATALLAPIVVYLVVRGE